MSVESFTAAGGKTHGSRPIMIASHFDGQRDPSDYWGMHDIQVTRLCGYRVWSYYTIWRAEAWVVGFGVIGTGYNRDDALICAENILKERG